ARGPTPPRPRGRRAGRLHVGSRRDANGAGPASWSPPAAAAPDHLSEVSRSLGRDTSDKSAGFPSPTTTSAHVVRGNPQTSASARQQLARIEDPLRIEQILQVTVDPRGHRTELVTQPVPLQQADPVFAGHRSAELQPDPHDRSEG